MEHFALDATLNFLAATDSPDAAPGIIFLGDWLLCALDYLMQLFGCTYFEGGYAKHGWWLSVVMPLIGILIMLGPIVTIFPMFAIWLERKVSAHMQSRLGPMEVGWHGFLQTVADGVKLLAKEDIIPKVADKALFILGPILAFTGIFVILAVLPFGPYLSVTDMHLGIVFVAAVGSLEVVGVLMAGWASNNKWSLFGTMRLATQLVSYEIPLGLCFLAIVVVSGSMRLGAINGDFETRYYQVVDESGKVLKSYKAEDVEEYRQYVSNEARNAYRESRNQAVIKRVVDQFSTEKNVLRSAKDADKWQDLFLEPVKAYRNVKSGEVYKVEEVMAEVAKTWDLNRGSKSQADIEKLVAQVKRAKFGTIEGVPAHSASVLFTVDGRKVEASQVKADYVKAAIAAFEKDETENQRVVGLLKARFHERFEKLDKGGYGKLRAVEGYSGQAGWLYNWYVFRNPFMVFMLIIFFTASLAENKRAPFDLPEAESELVSGFHTEYSGMRFSIFFLAEYVAMFVVSLLCALMFLGGWNTGIEPLDMVHIVDDPVVEGAHRVASLSWDDTTGSALLLLHVAIGHGTIMAKTLFFVFVQMWLRWTLPRVRLDHVMDLCLKVLLPFALAGLVLVAGWELLCAYVPIIDFVGRRVLCLLGLGTLGAWAMWFYNDFQSPLQTSMQEKPWDTSGAFLK